MNDKGRRDFQKELGGESRPSVWHSDGLDSDDVGGRGVG